MRNLLFFDKEKEEKGVSLIITFFIMIIILTAVLFISRLMYSEIRIIRNVSNSIVAFYSADSGIEKVFYYNRKILPDLGGGRLAERGFCTMGEFSVNNPDACIKDPGGQSGDKSIYCNEWTKKALDSGGEGCNPDKCDNCKISFTTDLSVDKFYSVEAQITPGEEENSVNLNIKSKGRFRNTLRQVEVDTKLKKTTGLLKIEKACVQPRSIMIEEEVEFLFSAFAQIGGVELKIAEAKARIRDNRNNIFFQELSCDQDRGLCSGSWAPPAVGSYYVDIIAKDQNNMVYAEKEIPPCDIKSLSKGSPSFEVYHNSENSECGQSLNCTPYPTLIETEVKGPESGVITISAKAFDISGVYNLTVIIRYPSGEEKRFKMYKIMNDYYVVPIEVGGWEGGEYNVSIEAVDSLMNNSMSQAGQYLNVGNFTL